MRFGFVSIMLAFSGLPGIAKAQIPVYDGPKFEMSKLADDIYAFVFDNPLGPAVDGTAVVIINDDDVVVVDAQNTPVSTRRVLAEIRKLTSKPVRYVVTTHWHGDHWEGNQVYQDSFPGVDFIAHFNTRDDIMKQALPTFDSTYQHVIPQYLRDFEARYATGIRRDGKPYTHQDSAYMETSIALFRWLVPSVQEIRHVTPTMTVADSLILHRGDRTIAIRWLGRGNTRGDLSVWLPKERILATGDLLVHPGPYSFGSYLSEWIQTLGKLRALNAQVIIPGHGAIQRDYQYMDQVVELLQYTLDQARDAVAKGLDLEATRKAIDFESFRQRFTGGDAARIQAFDGYFVQPAVERAWLEARGELDKTQ
jgi:glyoxylase-like metal-dependent hydrolase (beta-lactamase superfamily II)